MKRIDKLTPKQEARMDEWAEKWIAIGLKTGEADIETFTEAAKVAYQKANIPFPSKVIVVQSPLIGAFAAPIANKLIKDKTGRDGAVDDAVRGAVGGAVGDAVHGAVDGAVHGAVDGAVRGAVGGAVGDAVRGAVANAVGGAVGDAVGDAVRGAVDGAVRGAVGGAVGDAVGGAVDYIKKNWYTYLGAQFWVGGWYWGSPSYVSFFTEVCDLELSQDMQERAKAWQDIAKSACWWWPYRDFIMVCNRPSKIERDEQGRLHSETGQAIEWPDGWGFHALHGMRFDQESEPELWQKMVDRTITAQEVMSIRDTDKRSIAMFYLKPLDLIEQLKGKLVHTGVKGNRLYKFKNIQDSGRTEYMLLMDDASTTRQFIHGVEQEGAEDLGYNVTKDADHATAYMYRDGKGLPVPIEDYLLISQEA